MSYIDRHNYFLLYIYIYIIFTSTGKASSVARDKDCPARPTTSSPDRCPTTSSPDRGKVEKPVSTSDKRSRDDEDEFDDDLFTPMEDFTSKLRRKKKKSDAVNRISKKY